MFVLIIPREVFVTFVVHSIFKYLTEGAKVELDIELIKMTFLGLS